MCDMFFQILGIEQSAVHVSDPVLFVTLSVVAMFVIGEIFNIIRTAIGYFFE